MRMKVATPPWILNFVAIIETIISGFSDHTFSEAKGCGDSHDHYQKWMLMETSMTIIGNGC